MKIRLTILLIFLVAAVSLQAQDFYYLGVYSESGQCQVCHAETISQWEMTGHAVAQDSVQSDHYGYNCLECHNTGWNPDVNNNGADEYVVENPGGHPDYTVTDQAGWDRMKNVQCEACHGPVGKADGTKADAHMARVTDFDSGNCGVCHQGTHHPYYTEWQASGHASGPPAWFVNRQTNGECFYCHFAQDFVAFLEDPNYDPATFDPQGDDTDMADVTCAACHDPHGSDNPGDLRSLPAGHEEDVICDVCHTAHIAEVDINDEPHHTTSEVLSGTELFGYQYEGEDYSNSFHSYIEDRCVACHVNQIDFNPTLGYAVTGHTFEPTIEACQECHTDYNITDFDYRGVQSRVKGLLATLKAELDTASPADSLTDRFKKANYNYMAVMAEGSYGIHNTDLVVELLRDAIDRVSTSVEEFDSAIPEEYVLEQNYPNPFNPSTTIRFSIPEAGNVRIVIYDALGKEVTELVNEFRSPGTYNANWNAGGLSSGIYFYMIEAGNFTKVNKMLLVK